MWSKLGILIFCTLVGLCGYTHAQTTPKSTARPVLTSFEIVSVSMMDDHQLVSSAQFLRENRTATDKQLLNLLWLLEDTDLTFGAHSYVQLFQERLEAYWENSSFPSVRFSRLLKLNNLQLMDQGNVSYRLRVSDDKVAVQYRYSF